MSDGYAEAEAAFLQQLRKRGHWEVVVRPSPYRQRIQRSKDLLPIIERAALDLGGWRFPYLQEPGAELQGGRRHRDEDSQRQIHRWEHHLEAWRFFRSGQFALVTSVGWDWRDESSWWPVKERESWSANSRIGIGHVVQMLLQVFLFTTRLAESPAGDEAIDIEIVLAPTEGRELFSDFPTRTLRPWYKADIDRIRLHLQLSRSELFGQVDALIFDAAVQVFGEFGFRPEANILKDIISEVQR